MTRQAATMRDNDPLATTLEAGEVSSFNSESESGTVLAGTSPVSTPSVTMMFGSILV